MSHDEYNSPTPSKGDSAVPGVQEPQTTILPKVRKSNVSRSGSVKRDNNQFTPNAAPATPRMLRSTSNHAGLSDEYKINLDFASQGTSTKNSPFNISQSEQRQPQHNKAMSSGEHSEEEPKRLLPGVDFNDQVPIASSQRVQHPSTSSTSNTQPMTPRKPLSRSSSQQSSQNRSVSHQQQVQLKQQQQQHQQQHQQHQELQQQARSQTNSEQHQQFQRKSIGDWDFAKTIGAGSMGKVKLAKHRITNEVCAVKVVPRAARIWQRQHMDDPPTNDPNEISKRRKEFDKEVARDRRTIREGAFGRILYHPYICRLYEMFPMTNHYYMLFEYVSGGQMLDYIVAHGSLKERHARKFCRGIASALDYCHSNNIVHRDLKIENIMINRTGEIKIIDFGLSNLFDGHNLLKTYCGSLYFAAPELLSAHPYIGPEVDVWSFGVVLYVLVCGRVPFDDPSVSSLHEKIKRGNVEYPDSISKSCISLLSRMLVVDPLQRATLKEVISHPWMIKGFDGPASSYIPHRVPLELPLDEEVLQTIVDYELGNEDQVYHDLTEIIMSETYQRAARNWYIKNIHEEMSSYDDSIPDPTNGYHPLISIYHLVDEMIKRKKMKDEAARLRLQQTSAHPFTTPQLAQQSVFAPATPSSIPQQRVFSQPIPPDHQPPLPQFPPDASVSPPVLTFPQAAYTSQYQQSVPIPATQIQRPRAVTQGGAVTNQSPPPQQQIPVHGEGSLQQQGFTNTLFRKLSSKRSKNEEAPEELSPVRPENELVVEKFSSRSNDMVRRVGSMKITTKEKQQQLQLPPLPSTSKQQIQHHQRATSAYTPSAFVSDSPKVITQGSKESSQATPSTETKLLPNEVIVQENRRFHPSARAKSMGHTRKHSLSIPKSTGYSISDAPPVPQIQLSSSNNDDGFFDDVDMDEITFDEDYTKPKKRLPDSVIMSQFEHAAPGTMPSIEYPKTMFLKGFFSVQTTSTKPLPIIRYDIISVLPQLGVKFTEVRGGFVCIHYPSIITNELVKSSLKDTGMTEDETEALKLETGQPEEKTELSSRNDTVVEIEEVKTPGTSEASSQKTTGKRTSLSSSSSAERQRTLSDEHATPETPVAAEKVSSSVSNTSTPSKNGHRRKFSLGNGLLGGYRKQKEKERPTISTNVGPNNELNIPTTPAPANFVRRNSYESSESLAFEDSYGGSDMLVSSRVEQQNKVRSPTVANTSMFDNKDKEAAGTAQAKISASKTPLKFEIHIAKVPLVGLYGVQFKKVSGNTWLYKSLASEILNRLNL